MGFSQVVSIYTDHNSNHGIIMSSMKQYSLPSRLASPTQSTEYGAQAIPLSVPPRVLHSYCSFAREDSSSRRGKPANVHIPYLDSYLIPLIQHHALTFQTTLRHGCSISSWIIAGGNCKAIAFRPLNRLWAYGTLTFPMLLAFFSFTVFGKQTGSHAACRDRSGT